MVPCSKEGDYASGKTPDLETNVDFNSFCITTKQGSKKISGMPASQAGN